MTEREAGISFDPDIVVVRTAMGNRRRHAFDEKGNNAAGTRVRKAMQNLKELAQEIRVEVQKIKSDG